MIDKKQLSQIETGVSPNNDMNVDLKSWVMIALTFIFIILYILALTGRLESLKEWEMVTRLEPVIFVIIGYYFGRLPAQQNEKTLKDEISRQTNRADAAQNAKEQALQVREGLEEKVKNAKVVLTAHASQTTVNYREKVFQGSDKPNDVSGSGSLVSAVIHILDS